MIHAPLRTFEFAPDLEKLYHAVTILKYFSRNFKCYFSGSPTFNLPFMLYYAFQPGSPE